MAQASNVAQIGDNSSKLHPAILKYFGERVDVDVQRKALTERMSENRKVLKDAGLDTQAVDREYMYFKLKKHDREGYDETVKLTHEALNKAKTGDIFAPLYEVKD